MKEQSVTKLDLSRLRLVIACVCIAACATTEADFERQLVDESLSEERMLPSELATAQPSDVLAAPAVMGYPWSMLLYENLVVVTDASGSPYVHVFDTAGRHYLSAGRFGQGPGDFASGPMIAPDPDDSDRAWLFDQLSNRLSRVRLDSLKGERWLIDSIVQGELGRTSRAATALGDGYFAFWGRAENRLLTIESQKGTIKSSLEYVREADSIPESEQFKAYSFKTCSPPRSPRIAIAYYFTSRLDLVGSSADSTVTSAAVPISFPPYVDRHALLARPTFKDGSPNNRRAFLGCAANESVVLALFSGVLNRTKRGRLGGSDIVLVFRWTGQYVTALRLDHVAAAIAVDSATSTLYSATLYPEPTIRRTPLGMSLLQK